MTSITYKYHSCTFHLTDLINQTLFFVIYYVTLNFIYAFPTQGRLNKSVGPVLVFKDEKKN